MLPSYPTTVIFPAILWYPVPPLLLFFFLGTLFLRKLLVYAPINWQSLSPRPGTCVTWTVGKQASSAPTAPSSTRPSWWGVLFENRPALYFWNYIFITAYIIYIFWFRIKDTVYFLLPIITIMILIMKILLHNEYKIINLWYPRYVYQFFNFPYNYKNRVLACFQTRPMVSSQWASGELIINN